MNLYHWFSQRGPAYIARRGTALLERYGLTPSKAAGRVLDSVAMLADFGCAPTFPVPARIVERYPAYFLSLQNAGAELAVHGYHHVDLRDYPVDQAAEQLVKAAQVFDQHGIEVHGFRCPYLSWNRDVAGLLPAGVFAYSSNKAIDWNGAPVGDIGQGKTSASAVLQGLYQPASARDTVCTPWTYPSGILEIPVSLPDDLELMDSLKLSPSGVTEAWSRILHQTHRRGELFVLMFHPELAWRCAEPFARLLQQAQSLQPHVWIATLRDISRWWQETARFAVHTHSTAEGLELTFTCSDQATILAKGLKLEGSAVPWTGIYSQVLARKLTVPAQPRPFVGLPPDAPDRVVSFLREQGYLLDLGETAPLCATYLDATALAKVGSDLALLEIIEGSPGPLVRYWRWPDAARSALCISGDLDALALVDYADRLFAR